METPYSYAKAIAYIGDPSTVRVRTLGMFGRAPSLRQCSELVDERKARFSRPPNRGGRDSTPTKGDEQDFSVKGRGKRAKAIVAAPIAVPVPSATEPAPPPALAVMPSDVFRAIANKYCITVANLKGKTRSRRFVVPRNMAAYVLKQRGSSYPNVGHFLGGRDHSTVIHAIRRFEEMASPEEREFAAKLIGGVA